jgi:ADP-ribose pyrophosphatase YjhB (NUDIX family)
LEESTGPEKNMWKIPKGRIDPGELVEEGFIREVKEETNIDIGIVYSYINWIKLSLFL